MRKPKKPGKKRPSVFQVGFANLVFIQNKIWELRNAEGYQAAEAQRQADGSGTMAAGTAAQQAAIRLMIATWESIANMVLPIDQIGQETVFGSTPVGYMWDGLYAAILVYRPGEPGYASKFEALYTAYGNWIGTKPSDYQSRAAQGLNANFG